LGPRGDFSYKKLGERTEMDASSPLFLPTPFLTVEASLTLRVSYPHNNPQPTAEYTVISSQQQIASQNNQQPTETCSQQQNAQ
jgi:hypothetical protein